MNKYKQVLQQTVKQAIMALVIVALAAGVYFGIDAYAQNVKKAKDDANSKYTSDQSTLSSLKSQYDKSGEAEKRYRELTDGRSSSEFTGAVKDLSAWILTTRERYNIQMKKSAQGTVAPSDKTELNNFPYTVNVRSRTSVDLAAVSDVHVFSFIEEMARSAPGLVRVDMLSLKRNVEMSDSTIENFKKGTSALMVDATIEFSLIGFQPKETEKPATTAGAPPGAGK